MCLEVIWELFILDTFRGAGTLKRNFESPAARSAFQKIADGISIGIFPLRFPDVTIMREKRGSR